MEHGCRNLNDARKTSTIMIWKWELVGRIFYLRGATEEARSPVLGHDHTDEGEKNKRGCKEQSDAAVISDAFHTQRLSVATLWSAGELLWLVRREVKTSNAASATFSIFFPSCCFRFSYITILFQSDSWKSSFSTVWEELTEFPWLHLENVNSPSTPIIK